MPEAKEDPDFLKFKGSTVRGNMSIPEIVERLHRVQLMNEELVEKTGIAELQWCETNKEVSQFFTTINYTFN